MLRILGLKSKSSRSTKSSCAVPNPTNEGNMVDTTIKGCCWPPRRRLRPSPSEVEDNVTFVTDNSRDGDGVEDKEVVLQQLIPSSSTTSLVKHHCWTSEEEEEESESSESLNLRKNKEEDDDRQKLKIMWAESLYKNVVPHTFTDTEELEKKARAAEELPQSLLLQEEDLTKTSYGGGKGEIGCNKAESMTIVVETLQQKVKTLLQEKRNLALDLASEIRGRMAERYVANEAFMLTQKEKIGFQSSLEKELELDRRSNKQEKIKFGELRLRDRIRDLAEQNVALQRQVSDMKENTHLAYNEALMVNMNGKKHSEWQLENLYYELSELQDELNSQTLITRLVREKLGSRDLEVEQLQEDIATLLKNQEIYKVEIKRMQNLVGSANNKVADLESQTGRKDEIISGLEDDLQRCLKQIEVLKEDLCKVSKDRDMIREEAERFGFEVVRLNAEVEASQKAIENLDEDVMFKNGQISILRECVQEFYSTNI